MWDWYLNLKTLVGLLTGTETVSTVYIPLRRTLVFGGHSHFVSSRTEDTNNQKGLKVRRGRPLLSRVKNPKYSI